MWLHPDSFWTGVLQPKIQRWRQEKNVKEIKQNIPGQYFHPFFRISRSNPCCLQLCSVWELASGLRHSLHQECRQAGNGQIIIRWFPYSTRSTFIVCLHLVQKNKVTFSRSSIYRYQKKTYFGQCKMTECAINWRAYNFSRSCLERSSLSTTACVISFKRKKRWIYQSIV